MYINKDSNNTSDTYSDYSESQSESSSDSSTTTTEYEPHDWVNQAQSVENANGIKNILKEQLIQPVMGKPFKPLFSENEIDDSFELALLRFLHLIFSADGVINFDNLTKYMDMSSPKSNKLQEFFMNNPGVMTDYSFYYSNAGIDIRTKWVELLGGYNFFTYKDFANKQEIKPDVNNFLEFFENFFPNLDFSGNTIQEKLDTILPQLNFNFASLEAIHSTYQKISVDTIHTGTLLNFRINGIDLFVFEFTKLKEMNGGQPVEVFADCEFRYA